MVPLTRQHWCAWAGKPLTEGLGFVQLPATLLALPTTIPLTTHCRWAPQATWMKSSTLARRDVAGRASSDLMHATKSSLCCRQR